MGRNAKPVELLLMEGKSRKSKAELERRRENEIKLTNNKLVANPQVKRDKRALKEFKNLKKLYEDILFIGALDSYLVNQYCLSVSELDDFVSLLHSYREKARDENLEDDERTKLLEKILTIDMEIRLKRTEIMKMGDRLYLNPVSRTKNLPKKQEEKADENAYLFG